MWESSGWINPCDPYGWFQWYCWFYLGRRTSDDERQIGRRLLLEYLLAAFQGTK